MPETDHCHTRRGPGVDNKNSKGLTVFGQFAVDNLGMGNRMNRILIDLNFVVR